MTERLITSFAVLADRGTVAGADTVWQRAVLAAAADGGGPDRAAEGGVIPLVAVTPRGMPDPSWVEVRAGDPFAARRGRARVGLAVGLSAAALVGAGISAVALRDGGDGQPERVPGAPGDPAATTVFVSLPDTSAPADPDSETTFVEASPTTAAAAGAVVVDTTAVLGSGFAIGQPCVSDPSAGTSVAPASTAADDTAFPPTTPGGSMSGSPDCAYAAGTLPPVTDGPGSDWVSAPTTLPADAALVYWRMLEDLDITWRDEPDGPQVYWRTPAGQGSAVDGFGGAVVLMVPAVDRYIVLARAGTTANGAPGQRPVQVRATLADGSAVAASLTYDNDLGIGHAYVETTQPIVQIAAV